MYSNLSGIQFSSIKKRNMKLQIFRMLYRFSLKQWIWIIILRHSKLTMTQCVAGKKWMRKSLTACRAVPSSSPLPLFTFNSFSMCVSLNSTESKQIMHMARKQTLPCSYLNEDTYLTRVYLLFGTVACTSCQLRYTMHIFSSSDIQSTFQGMALGCMQIINKINITMSSLTWTNG